jgi:hypothetical protein
LADRQPRSDESTSQFSRDYPRMFGLPPKRDSSELKAIPA